MRRALIAPTLLTAIMLAVTLPQTAEAGRFSAGFAAETWASETGEYAGILVVAYDFDPWIAKGYPSIVFDTDTMRLSLTEMHLGESWRLGFELTGELSIAGLLPYYYVDGETVPERGFDASYAEAAVRIKRLISGGGWIELAVAGRQWGFLELEGDTEPDLTLPPDTFMLRPKLHVGWWKLDDDEGWWQRHRFHPRLKGWAIGLDFGADVRTDDSAWGNIGDTLEGRDGRNQPEQIAPNFRQWFMFGLPLGQRARLEISEFAAFGIGEDDLTRERVGGMSPYVVEMPGAPWPAWVSERLIATRVSLPFRVFGDVEMGPSASAMLMADKDRINSDDMDFIYGAGAVIDARFGAWQVDLRGGVCPPVRDDQLSWSAYLGLGWGG